MADFHGETKGEGMRFAVIASRYNDFITGKLVAGARECLKENGVAEENIDVYWCPGALEIPALAARVARHGLDSNMYNGMVCVGCVIRGATDHYYYVAGEAMRGVTQIALEAKVAIGNAILTVENVEQAVERSGERTSNKGWEAALAALEIANHFKRLR